MSTDALSSLAASLNAGLAEQAESAQGVVDGDFSGNPATAEWELRDAAAKRLLIAAILAEPHDYIPGDSWYSCSQAVVPDPADDEDRIPGSGCMDDSRRGQPCDCGRDARAERLLGILAGIYDETGEQQR